MRTAVAIAAWALLAPDAARAQDIIVQLDPPVAVRTHSQTRVTQDAHTTRIWSRTHVRRYGPLTWSDSLSTEHTVITLHPGTTYFEYTVSAPVVRCETVAYGPFGPTVTRCGPGYVPVRRIVIRR